MTTEELDRLSFADMDRAREERPFVTECDCPECEYLDQPLGRIFKPKELPRDHSNKRTPWAVECDRCGLVHLTRCAYGRQMNAASSMWYCPKCSRWAQWSDEEHEAWENTQEAMA